MSRVAANECVALGATDAQFEAHPVRDVQLGSIHVRRALPLRERRLIGPWCFLDRFGPASLAETGPMDLAAHPHMGLQTVTWLLEGETVHYDSLGNEGLLTPRGVNVMTSGHAIAHAERTPSRHSDRLSGAQLWTALPDGARNGPASFQHVAEVPVFEGVGGLAHVFSGRIGNQISPAEHFSGIVGADVIVHRGQPFALPLERDHEHGVLLLEGDCSLDGQDLRNDQLYYLGTHRTELTLQSNRGARVLLVGGVPFPETILMWWNFVARTPDEIREARDAWEANERFGDVPGYGAQRLAAPDLGHLAQPNPAS